jgi:L-seryl-tRNA(Ser) seleniumtransferase
MPKNDSLRGLPSVDRLLMHPLLAGRAGGPLRAAAARMALNEARAGVRSGEAAPNLEALVVRAAAALTQMERPSLRPVINATGVILHTNHGRAPLSDAALAAMQLAGLGYSNLEFDLESGGRGSRFSHLDELLQRVTGAEAGIAVNNNASAMVLLLSALCRDREVIVSRSQAVEIGGGFRIPDLLRQSGAILIEVGTTNRTTVADYAEAMSDLTVAILRVHASNFRIIGFTAFPALAELAALARRRGVLLLDDLGSGCMIDTRRFGMLPEPTVQESIAEGVDVVAFSGDKLLGGPQAGILAGRRAAIDALRKHPLARAVRMDKTGIAALAATLQHYLRDEALDQIPVWRMISTPLDEIRRRARRWAAASSLPAGLQRSRSMIGGGSLPEEGVETWVASVDVESADAAAAWLRRRSPAIVGRIENGRLLLDPRTVPPRDDMHIRAALKEMPDGTLQNHP